MSQLAGAGLLSGDPYARSLKGNNIGVLASVRKCTFARPVVPNADVKFTIHCRQMGPAAVQVTATASLAGTEVAQLETLMVYAEKDQIHAVLNGSI
jgi:3-hydroxyacyl-[acyl-carrier-protein] dehydratase